MKKNDLILAGAVLLIACLLLLFRAVAFSSRGKGTVVVYRGQERIAAYPLEEDREEIFLSPDGGMNRLVIRGGEARIEDADCPDRLCVKQGAVSSNGQAITCLPHRLVVTVEDGREAELDALVR